MPRRSGDRPYPPGMGLRPIRHAHRHAGKSRCLTLLRPMDPAIRENGNSESGALPEPPMDMLGVSPSQTEVFMPEMRPGQSADRDRTRSWWDVLPIVPRCGKACFMCGLPCNRPLGKHFIRLADDNPAHLCCQHDLHELYGE